MRKIVKTFGWVVIAGVGASLLIVADLGVNAYDALSISIAKIFKLKVGTITILFNLCFFLFQVLLTKGKIGKERFLQIPILLVLGSTINLMTYTFLSRINIGNYSVKLLILTIGTILCAFSCAELININIGFPLEAFCKMLSEKQTLEFRKIRQGWDIICLLLIIVLWMIYDNNIPIREGTIISMITLGPLIQYRLDYINK